MFIGHFAVALASKKAAPKVSLGTLLFSVTFLDLLWPLFILLGFEHVRIDPGNTAVTPLDFYDYPISHSLLAVLAWSIAFGGIYYLIRKEKIGSLVLGFGVLSHWILDLVTHRPDLLIVPWGTMKAGLGLWYSLPFTVVVEGGMFILALSWYFRTTSAKDRTGSWSLWVWIIFVSAAYGANLFSPPPPSSAAIGTAGLAGWLFLPWGYWIDRHRQMRTASPT